MRFCSASSCRARQIGNKTLGIRRTMKSSHVGGAGGKHVCAATRHEGCRKRALTCSHESVYDRIRIAKSASWHCLNSHASVTSRLLCSLYALWHDGSHSIVVAAATTASIAISILSMGYVATAINNTSSLS